MMIWVVLLLTQPLRIEACPELEPDGSEVVTCHCITPNAGTIGSNDWTCTDGDTGHCPNDQECFRPVDSTFRKTEAGSAANCRVPLNEATCSCSTSTQWSCTNGVNGSCQPGEECRRTDMFSVSDPACQAITAPASSSSRCSDAVQLDTLYSASSSEQFAQVDGVENTEACATLCGASARCQGWIYNKNTSSSEFRRCVLLSAYRPSPSTNAGFDSGDPCTEGDVDECPLNFFYGGECGVTQQGTCCTAQTSSSCDAACVEKNCVGRRGVWNAATKSCLLEVHMPQPTICLTQDNQAISGGNAIATLTGFRSEGDCARICRQTQNCQAWQFGNDSNGSAFQTCTLLDGGSITSDSAFAAGLSADCGPSRVADTMCGFDACAMYYDDITGVAVSDLTSDAKFPARPDLVTQIPSLRTRRDRADNYGVLVEAWIRPLMSGDYVFITESDDSSEVFVHTVAGEKPSTTSAMTKVVELTACCIKKTGSVTISMDAGKSYYLRGLMKEGFVADRFIIGMTHTSSNTESFPIGPDQIGAPTVVGNQCSFNSAACALYYDNIQGIDVSDLTSAPSFPNNPNEASSLAALSFDERADNYGAMIEAWVEPPQTGDYTFITESDDTSAIYVAIVPGLKPESISEMIKVVEVPTCCGTERGTITVHMEVGSQYLVRGLMKELLGGDRFRVGMTHVPTNTEYFPLASDQLVRASTVNLAKSTYTSKERVEVSWVNMHVAPTIDAEDSLTPARIAVYPSDAIDGPVAPAGPVYSTLTCGTDPCRTIKRVGSLMLPTLEPGNYRAVVIRTDSADIIARSAVFTVTAPFVPSAEADAGANMIATFPLAANSALSKLNTQHCQMGQTNCCGRPAGTNCARGYVAIEDNEQCPSQCSSPCVYCLPLASFTREVGYGWNPPVDGEISCRGSQTNYHGTIGLRACQDKCNLDPLCRSIFGGLEKGDNSCWTCNEYVRRPTRTVEPFTTNNPGTPDEYSTWELTRSSLRSATPFFNSNQCPDGFAPLSEAECDGLARDIVSTTAPAPAIRSNSAPGGCTLPLSPTNAQDARPIWSTDNTVAPDATRNLICKPVIPTDGLNSLTTDAFADPITSTPTSDSSQERAAPGCVDGLLHTWCQSPKARGAYLQFELRTTLVVMRLFVANRADASRSMLGRFDVLVYDGHAWQSCKRRQAPSIQHQWTEVLCDEPRFGQAIRIQLSDDATNTGPLQLADVRVQGITPEAAATRRATFTTQYNELENVKTCTTAAILKDITCPSSADCRLLGKQACDNFGQRCWGYAISDGEYSDVQSVQLYDARAADPNTCFGFMGLESHRMWTTYKRAQTTMQHVIHYDRACWTYDYYNDKHTIKDSCRSQVQRTLAEENVAQLRQMRKCLILTGQARTACIGELQWRRQVGEPIYEFFNNKRSQTRTCRSSNPNASTSRRLDEESLEKELEQRLLGYEATRKLSNRLSGEPSVRRRLQTSNCRRTAQLTNTAACNSLQAAADASVELYGDQIALAEAQADQLKRNADLQRASDWLGVGGAGLEMAAGIVTLNPFAAVSGTFGFLGAAVGARSASRQRQLEIEIAQEEVALLRREADIAVLEDASDIVQVCDQASTDDLKCSLQEVTDQVEDRFLQIINVATEQATEVLRVLANQNRVVTRTSLTLSSIQQALTFVNSQLGNLAEIRANFEEAVNALEQVRIDYARFNRTNLDSIADFEYCQYLSNLADLSVLENIERWTVSPEFFQTTKPQNVRVSGEHNIVTTCEIDQWRTDYTLAHRSNEVLFSFAANIRKYTLEWNSPLSEQNIARMRSNMAFEYTKNLEELQKMSDETQAIRCVGSAFQCPSTEFPTHGNGITNADPEPVTRLPCEANSCSCSNGSPDPSLDCTQNNGVLPCVSCNRGFILDGIVCNAVQAICPNGTPRANLEAPHHNMIHCATCNTGYEPVRKVDSTNRIYTDCVALECTCQHGTGFTGDTPAHCSASEFQEQRSKCRSCDNGRQLVSFVRGGRTDSYCFHNNLAFVVYSEGDFNGDVHTLDIRRSEQRLYWVWVGSLIVYPGWCAGFREWHDGSGNYSWFCNCHNDQVSQNRAVGFDFRHRGGYRWMSRTRCNNTPQWFGLFHSPHRHWTRDGHLEPSNSYPYLFSSLATHNWSGDSPAFAG